MKLYAIRDRLLNYFMTPFVADGDKPVMHSLTQLVNGGTDHAVSKAPHHFELWALATINEDTGNVQGPAEFLCDCASLVRGDIWPQRVQGPAGGPNTTDQRTVPPKAPNGRSGTLHSSAEGPKGPENLPAP